MPKDRNCSDYAYVRRMYGVPAYAGVKVNAAWQRSDGKPGVIQAKHDDNYVHVVFDGQKHSVPVHPTDLEYHP